MAAQLQDQPQFSDHSSDSAITYQEQGSKHDDAVQYVLSVRNTFGDNDEKYLHFLALLDAFGANRMTMPVVISRLKLLFSEHQELLEGFNQFLPGRIKNRPPTHKEA